MSSSNATAESCPSAPSYDDLYGSDKPPPPYHLAINSGPPPPYFAHSESQTNSPSLSSLPTPPPAYPLSPASTTVNNQPHIPTQTQIIIQDGCPVCQGPLMTDFPLLCWLVACIWFPVGVLCCLMSARKRCAHCGQEVG